MLVKNELEKKTFLYLYLYIYSLNCYLLLFSYLYIYISNHSDFYTVQPFCCISAYYKSVWWWKSS